MESSTRRIHIKSGISLLKTRGQDGLERPFNRGGFRVVFGELIGDKALGLMAFLWLLPNAIGYCSV